MIGFVDEECGGAHLCAAAAERNREPVRQNGERPVAGFVPHAGSEVEFAGPPRPGEFKPERFKLNPGAGRDPELDRVRRGPPQLDLAPLDRDDSRFELCDRFPVVIEQIAADRKPEPDDWKIRIFPQEIAEQRRIRSGQTIVPASLRRSAALRTDGGESSGAGVEREPVGVGRQREAERPPELPGPDDRGSGNAYGSSMFRGTSSPCS